MLLQNYAIQPLEKETDHLHLSSSLENNQAEQYTTKSYLSEEMNHSVVA